VLDLWYLIRQDHMHSVSTLIGGCCLAGLVGVLTSVVAAWVWLPSPKIDFAELPLTLIVGLMTAVAAGNAGARLGSWLAAWQRPRVVS
jgi:hypothetical protein